MISISAASARTYQSPLQKLQDELLSEVKSGAIKSSDKDALASALTDIDSAMQASRASGQASGTRPSPADMKSKIDELIAGEVCRASSRRPSPMAPAAPAVLLPAVRRPPMARPPARTLRRARHRSTTFSSSSCNRCRNRCRLRHRRATAQAAIQARAAALPSRHC
jgi:hypothetical protein